MSDINAEIRSHVDAFVSKLSSLVRKAALDAVTQALKGENGAPAARAPVAARKAAPPAKGAPKAAAPAARPAAKKAAPAVGQKRPPELIAKTTNLVYEHVKANPGQGIEQISKALNTPTKDLTLPIKKLIAEKKITSKGQRRATKYFPVR